MKPRWMPESLIARAYGAVKIGLYEVAHLLIRPVWWCLSLIWALSLIWTGKAPRTLSGHRRVLLLANNEMLARFAGDVAEQLAEDDRLKVFFSRPPFVDRRVPTSSVIAEVGVPSVSFLRALLTRWDLIVNPDHFPSALFHPTIPKIFSAHGLFTGKRVRGQPYEYGPRSRRWNGRPVYARIFASGAIERECALAYAPSLSGTLAVTGSLQVDALLERNRRRAEVRGSLGVPADGKALIVMSSWGPKCLLRRDGEWLLPRIQALTDEYVVFLAAHRNNFLRGTSASQDWSRFRVEMADSGIRLLDSREDWWQYLVAADLAVSDFTSLGLYFAQLVRPMVFVTMDEADFFPGSPLLQIYNVSPQLTQSDPLRGVLAHAERHYPLDKLRLLAERTVDFRGVAAERVCGAVVETLGLPPRPTKRPMARDAGN